MNQPECASQTPDSLRALAWLCALLTAVVVAAFPAFAWVGHVRAGATGIGAAAIAAGVCYFGALAALLAAGWARRSPQAVGALLAGTLLRTGVPLGVGLYLAHRGGPLAEAGVFGMIVAYYFITLIVETLLAVRLLRRPCRAVNPS